MNPSRKAPCISITSLSFSWPFTAITMGSVEHNSVEDTTSQHYDAIIVGGGTAGLVAAARLSEDPTKKILVIDAGVDRRGDPLIDTPGLITQLWGNPTYDWDYYTVPQEHADGRRIPQPRGRVLGGSSAINVTAMVYPTPANFESWTKLGNKGWSHADLVPYYRKLESFHPASEETSQLLSLSSTINPKAHGKTGPLSTTFPDAYGPFQRAWLNAFDSAGFTDKSDPIHGRHQGAFIPPNSVNPNGYQRSYAASAYYPAQVESRPNLRLLSETFVNRVLLTRSEDGLLEATGVEITTPDSNPLQIHAKDVILAAGAFQSPVVLENSGIGSKELLERHGIECLVDNPGVGENLQDHFFTTVSFEVADSQFTADAVRNPAVVAALLQQYAESSSGPLSGVPFSLAFTPPVDFNGVMNQDALQALVSSYSPSKSKSRTTRKGTKTNPGLTAQYDELLALLINPNESTCFYGLMSSQMNVKPPSEGHTSMPEAYAPQRPENFISIMVGLNHPFSRGSVHTAGKDPRLAPVIDPKYLSHPLDLEIMARGTQFMERIVQQPGLEKMLKPGKEGVRLPEYLAKDSLQDLEVAKRVVKDRLWTTYHPSCTCAMMPRETGGVVGDRLVVHGTRNLRVIDASVFPMIPMGNIQATVYAVAEKACDIVKEDWAARG